MKFNAKTQVVSFVLLTFFLSWGYEAFVILNGGVKSVGLPGLLLLMWIPGVVALVFRFIPGTGFANAGFRIGRPLFYLWAVVLPLGVAFLTNLVSVPLGMKTFGMISSAELAAKSGLVQLSLVLGMIGALGEEIGWRGFLLPKMIEARIWNPYVSSGIIWALWHLPLVCFGGYYQIDSPVLIALVYSFSIVWIGFVAGLLRMRSGSVWVATVFHAAHNFFFQLAIPHLVFTDGESKSKWWELVGADCGVVVGVLYLFAVFLFFRGRFPARSLAEGRV